MNQENYHQVRAKNDVFPKVLKGEILLLEKKLYPTKWKRVLNKLQYAIRNSRVIETLSNKIKSSTEKTWQAIAKNPTLKYKSNLDLKQLFKNYAADLKNAVEKFSIAESKYQGKGKKILQSLGKENVQSTTIEKNGSSYKMSNEADPQSKKMNQYNSNMKLVAKESIAIYQSVGKTEASLAIKEELGNNKKNELKQEIKPEKDKWEKKNDKTLLPKKRESSKKSLGLS